MQIADAELFVSNSRFWFCPNIIPFAQTSPLFCSNLIKFFQI